MLITNSQIESNLRRTASNGLISLLNKSQLEKLALDYFGIKNEYGDITGYMCPYSGKIYTDYDKLVLEHIIPVNSKGGTVLFNCIPTSEEVNKPSEKGAKHLISWWTTSKYWDNEAPQRLEKLINYILDGYDKVFDEYTIEEVENSYLEIEREEDILGEEEDLEYGSKKEIKILEKQSQENGIHSYLGFILTCIETLEKYNIDTTIIRQKLEELEAKHIFEDISRFQLFQNILQKIVVSRIGNDNRSSLTYILNFNTKKLMNSIKANSPEEIYNEIDLRLRNIESILKANDLSIIEYFKSLNDITDIDIIYKNITNISQNEINIFLENIKLGIDSKIDIFINMLNKGNSEILKDRNTETLEGYPSINLSQFWHNHKEKIQQRLFEDLKNNPKYDTARNLINSYKVKNDTDAKINIFINMLNKGNAEILTRNNNYSFEGYPSVQISRFWQDYKEKIQQRLFEDLKNNPKYDTARNLINSFNVENDIDAKIDIFIDMLNKGNSEILAFNNNYSLEGYPSINLSQFWHNHKEKIQQRLFGDLKDDPKYDTARNLINSFNVENDIDVKIDIFIDMLNKGNSEILAFNNNYSLEGYPNVQLFGFWNNHKEKIQQRLFEDLKDDSKYDTARKLIDNYIVRNSINAKIDIFINMLNKGNADILKSRNNYSLEGYPDVQLSRFWEVHKEKIIKKLFVELKDNPEYDVARSTVLKKLKVSSIEEYYEKEIKSKELKELKKMKKILEDAQKELTEETTEGRKRA